MGITIRVTRNRMAVITSGINNYEVIDQHGQTIEGNVTYKDNIRQRAIAKLR